MLNEGQMWELLQKIVKKVLSDIQYNIGLEISEAIQVTVSASISLTVCAGDSIHQEGPLL